MKKISENDVKKIAGGDGALEAMINCILATTPAFQDNQFGATAYTTGYDIYFTSYDPHDSLLPHEAWHVVQQ
jgi:hypothetical protein